VGSDKWIEIMKEPIYVKYFASSDEVENISQFENLINVCEYWNRPICLTLYIYYFLNHTEAQYYILEWYFKTYGYTLDELKNYILTIDRSKKYILFNCNYKLLKI